MPLKEYNLKLDINKILNNITNKDNQYTIPIFIPHLGCNNECVFCNQRKITGIDTSVTVDDVDNIINEHLDYKFIMALEGIDVASNLKWVMSSNSIAVMPRPTCETWFMEGTLIPNYHYIEIKPDFSDLEERLNYYIEHVDESLEIIRHAHEYVSQFKDKRRENLISLLVLDKYFKMTGQKS